MIKSEVFSKLPTELVYYLLSEYSDRFAMRNDKLVIRIDPKDFRYDLIQKIPKKEPIYNLGYEYLWLKISDNKYYHLVYAVEVPDKKHYTSVYLVSYENSDIGKILQKHYVSDNMIIIT